ncbi:MAG TPA: rhomboid family intramembrane serine protease, partial [Bryobacteraceae bacterium]|nr:rhomboid family intramembrane serine protease [Bryobacteraceae bacterium]
QLVLGASGAIYGLLLAYGMLFPNQEVLFSFLFPIKAKYMVMLVGAIAFLSSFQGGGTVSNLAHMGGMLFGFVYIRRMFASRSRKRPSLTTSRAFDPLAWWKNYKIQRAKKKFQVYMRKHGSGPGSWEN